MTEPKSGKNHYKWLWIWGAICCVMIVGWAVRVRMDDQIDESLMTLGYILILMIPVVILVNVMASALQRIEGRLKNR